MLSRSDALFCEVSTGERGVDTAPYSIVERASSLSGGLFLVFNFLDDAFFRVEELVDASITAIAVPSLDTYSHVRLRS